MSALFNIAYRGICVDLKEFDRLGICVCCFNFGQLYYFYFMTMQKGFIHDYVFVCSILWRYYREGFV
jgi:hypothetical protein